MPFPTSFATGDVLTAADLNTIAGAWDTYTPTVGGTGWALGNGTITGRWKKIGRVIAFRINVTWGTTSTFGAGNLTLSLPATAQATGFTGVARIIDGSPLTIFAGGWIADSTTSVSPHAILASGTYGTHSYCTTNVPFTWASTDAIDISGVYESAS